MADSETRNQNVVRSVEQLEESLKDMPTSLKLFSLSMRSLYTDKDVGKATEADLKFRELRDKTREDAKIYLKIILPLTTTFVSSVKEFFAYYDALSYEEWSKMLPSILEDIKANRELAQTILRMYEEMMVPLKKREDEARIIMTKFKDLQREYENLTKKFQGKAKQKWAWACGLLFIPGVNVIASPVLRLSANEDAAKAIAQTQQSKIHEAAALVVAQTLIPALANFIDGLTSAAGFFQIMEIELNLLVGKRGEAATEFENKQLHFKMMGKKVKEINPYCYAFYAALPAVRTDFEAIPDDGTEQNYIQKWLDKKLKEIERLKIESTQKAFWDVLKGVEGLCLKPKTSSLT